MIETLIVAGACTIAGIITARLHIRSAIRVRITADRAAMRQAIAEAKAQIQKDEGTPDA